MKSSHGTVGRSVGRSGRSRSVAQLEKNLIFSEETRSAFGLARNNFLDVLSVVAFVKEVTDNFLLLH